MKNLKPILIIIVFLLGIANIGLGQQTSPCQVPDVKKGKLMTGDGILINFKHLSCRNDTVYYTNMIGEPQKLAVANTFKVEKTGNYALILGGSLGIGALVGTLIGTKDWNGTSLEDNKGAYIVGMTVGFAALGGVIGLFIKKHKEVFRNPDFTFEFKISPLTLKPNQKYCTMGLRFRF
ncbi:MAG: hypothetical protein DRI83_10755 [Bacteroidetes bacterium]|nr:MAG: hypothetical protein DRI83_10755 [Bacteroidota bacterium]